MNSMVQEQVCDVVADTFGLNPIEVGGETSAQNTSAWTSLAHLRLIANLEQAFGLRFTMTEIPVLTSVQSIEDVLVARGVEP